MNMNDSPFKSLESLRILILAAFNTVNPLGKDEQGVNDGFYRSYVTQVVDNLLMNVDKVDYPLYLIRSIRDSLGDDFHAGTAENVGVMVSLITKFLRAQGALVPARTTPTANVRGRYFAGGCKTRLVRCPQCRTEKRIDEKTKRFRCPCGLDQPIDVVRESTQASKSRDRSSF